MKHLIKKEKNILHGTIGWSHNGKDGQYCEAGETVKIKWQPTAGWGLQEVHYTDDDGNVVAIEDGEFTMPSANITIDATFKKFVIGDWTSGKNAAENAGKVLGFDEEGNLVPVDGGGGGEKPIVVHVPQGGGNPYFYLEEKDLPIFPDYPQSSEQVTLFELQYGEFKNIFDVFAQDGDDPLYYSGEATGTNPKYTGYAYLYFETGYTQNVARIFPAKIVHD